MEQIRAAAKASVQEAAPVPVPVPMTLAEKRKAAAESRRQQRRALRERDKGSWYEDHAALALSLFYSPSEDALLACRSRGKCFPV